MRRALSPKTVLLASCLAIACGDDGDPGGGDSSSTASTTDAASGTDSTAGTMGTTTGTGGTDSTMGTGPGTGDASSGGAEDGIVYSAVSVPGDPNQIQIRRKDDENDRCTWIVLTDQSVGLLAIATPDGWTPQVGLTNSNADSCDGADPLVGGSQEASAGSGDVTASEPGMGAIPCSLDVDVELDFPQLDLVEVFAATDVAVQGC